MKKHLKNIRDICSNYFKIMLIRKAKLVARHIAIICLYFNNQMLEGLYNNRICQCRISYYSLKDDKRNISNSKKVSHKSRIKWNGKYLKDMANLKVNGKSIIY